MAVHDAIQKPAAAAKKPAAKKAAVKPAAKSKAKVAPADGIKKTPVASITTPPAARTLPIQKKPVEKAPAKDVKVKVPARLAKIFADFAKGGDPRTESLGGKVSKKYKAILEKEAKRLGVTPAALVAALVVNFLDSCAAE